MNDDEKRLLSHIVDHQKYGYHEQVKWAVHDRLEDLKSLDDISHVNNILTIFKDCRVGLSMSDSEELLIHYMDIFTDPETTPEKKDAICKILKDNYREIGWNHWENSKKEEKQKIATLYEDFINKIIDELEKPQISADRLGQIMDFIIGLRRFGHDYNVSHSIHLSAKEYQKAILPPNKER